MSNNTVKSIEEAASTDTKMNKTLLNSMYRRRMSCPQAVQQLWDAVRVIRYQRQIPNLARIAKYMQRVHNVQEEEVTRQLGYCVRDGLLTVTKRRSSKGAKVGLEQEGYKLPDSAVERDKHDWYCWECHTGGDVICCGSCNRVYHLSCISNLPGSKHKYLCAVCQSSEAEERLNVKQSRLNRLLSMTCCLLRDRYSWLVNSAEMLQRSISIGALGAQVDIGSEGWRPKYLIHKSVDIGRMSAKAKEGGYTKLVQFSADAHTIVHNVVIFHGVHSDMADRARQMLRDCLSELGQLTSCHSCYAASIAKPTRHWFCLPCKPPHQLVYAKAKGCTYWPAKVIKMEGDKYEVRFFGGMHCRATVDKLCVQPITTNPSSLQVKRSPSWSKACEELKRHQDILKRDVSPDSSSSSDDEVSMKSRKSSSKERYSDGESRSEQEEEEETKKEKDKEKGRKSRGTERKRGVGGGGSSSSKVGGEEAAPAVAKKKRGRPPRVQPPPETPTPSEQPPKRKRGRPSLKKKPAAESPAALAEGGSEERKEEREVEEERTMEVKEEVEEKEKEEGESENAKSSEEAAAETNPGVDTPERPQSPTTSSSTKCPDIKKNEEEIVSSSCMEPQFRCCGTQTKHDSKKANKEVINKLKLEIESLKTSHAEALKQLQQSHLQEVASTKKKQWCYNCEQEAIYHCCWNTAYCSTECQQVHWQREHKRVCRRKR